MGSKSFPYKGIIDHLANRGFSNGTNAWTDTDHTAYTVSTAGDQGFLQLLPIYVDHILYPTMTDAGFLTEVHISSLTSIVLINPRQVHHINAKGENSGVVYSEMQGRQNTAADLMAHVYVVT
jgi:Zn-dependent M16 (insulinase) family peptidase